MMKAKLSRAAVALLLLAGTSGHALAQSSRPASSPSAAADRRASRAAPGVCKDRPCLNPKAEDVHDFLMRNDRRYRSARKLKIAGAVIMSVAGGLGAMVGILGAATGANSTNLDDTITGGILMVVGFSVVAASLAAGIPLVVVGHTRQKRILRAVQPKDRQTRQGLVPLVGFTVGKTAGAVSATWRF